MVQVEAINYAGQPTLSFKQLDELNSASKGTAFSAFKRRKNLLVENLDFFYLAGKEHDAFIEQLKASGQIYRSTTHLVLLTRGGYERLLSPSGN